jgi:2-polyprenyl-3-methyl-5-hydroxy-6-metoxy-1,4-benzoquinol methylase
VSADLSRAKGLLDEAESSGLDLSHVPANTAKLRLLFDLRGLIPEDGALTVLDVGCGGKFRPFELWTPLAPFADRLRLTGVDVVHLEPVERRAREVGLPIELSRASALRLVETLGRDMFDVVVSTQVLEHIRDWPEALGQMRDVLRPGGTLLMTRPSGERARLVGKRAYARLVEAAPAVGRAGRGIVSADWELGPRRNDVHQACERLGLEVERLAWYGLTDLKTAQNRAGTETRLASLALEETIDAELAGEPPAERYRLLYLRARKP